MTRRVAWLALTVFLLAVAAACSGRAAREQIAATWQVADRLAADGQHAAAAQLYRQIADAGYGGAALYDNLGHAYYRQQEYGRAVWAWRRAALWTPRDPDLRANLAAARTAAATAAAAPAAAAGDADGSAVAAWTAWASPAELGTAALLCWLLWVAGLTVYRRVQRARAFWRAGLALLGLLWLGLGALLGVTAVLEQRQPSAVVVAGQAAVRPLPLPSAPPAFGLPAGAAVRIVATRGEWVEIETVGALRGWAPAAAVELVWPPTPSER